MKDSTTPGATDELPSKVRMQPKHDTPDAVHETRGRDTEADNVKPNAGAEQNTPGRSKSSSSRQQTQPDQGVQSGTAALDHGKHTEDRPMSTPDNRHPAAAPNKGGDHLHPSKDQDVRPWFASDDDEPNGNRAAKVDPAYARKEDPAEGKSPPADTKR